MQGLYKLTGPWKMGVAALISRFRGSAKGKPRDTRVPRGSGLGNRRVESYRTEGPEKAGNGFIPCAEGPKYQLSETRASPSKNWSALLPMGVT